MNTQNNDSIIKTLPSPIIKVADILSITDKLLSNEIEILFNQAFFLLNSKDLMSSNENYYFQLENSLDYRKSRGFKFIALYKSNYYDATQLLSSILQVKPNHSIFYEMRAIAYYRLENYQDSLNDFDFAIKINPNNPNLFYNRAIIKYLLKDYSGVINDCNEIIGISPYDADAFYQRGSAKMNLKLFKDAIIDYTLAISIDPTNADIFFKRGCAKLGANDWLGATDDYIRSLKINPKSTYNIYIKSRIQTDLKFKK